MLYVTRILACPFCRTELTDESPGVENATFFRTCHACGRSFGYEREYLSRIPGEEDSVTAEERTVRYRDVVC